MEISNRDLDALIAELSPGLPARGATEFLFDPESLEGYPTVRDYYVEYLDWLGLPRSVLPPGRLYIHGDRPAPANLEFRGAPGAAGSEVSLFLSQRLFRSFDVVKMALAHELTHLYLVEKGLQVLPKSVTTSLPEIEEVRTDVASILLGFGKLVVNGVAEYPTLFKRDGLVAQLGYLPVSSFAYLYRRVNERVGVPAGVADNGLNPAATQALGR